MPHMGTEFGQLLGVASNYDLCWEKAKIPGKKWEVMLPGCYLTILMPRIIAHK